MSTAGMKQKSLRQTLSCPVCDKLPTPPVYGCQNGHIICESCKAKVHHCSVCRAERFNVRCLVVEELLSSKVLPCENALAGCTHPLMTGEEYELHRKTCPFRQIECDCKDGSCHCRSQLVPYESYLDHLTEFHEAIRVDDATMNIRCDINGTFTPRIFKCYSHTFILLSHRNDSRFWTWVAAVEDMTDELFYARLTLRYKLPSQGLRKLSSDTLSVPSIRKLPDEVLKNGQCLEFSTSTLPDTAPPAVWPQYEPESGEGAMQWGYDVEIWPHTKSTGFATFRNPGGAGAAGPTFQGIFQGNRGNRTDDILGSLQTLSVRPATKSERAPKRTHGPQWSPTVCDSQNLNKYHAQQDLMKPVPAEQTQEDEDYEEYYTDDDEDDVMPQLPEETSENKNAGSNNEEGINSNLAPLATGDTIRSPSACDVSGFSSHREEQHNHRSRHVRDSSNDDEGREAVVVGGPSHAKRSKLERRSSNRENKGSSDDDFYDADGKDSYDDHHEDVVQADTPDRIKSF